MAVTVSALLIAGPTASGKSGLAIELARELGGTVVNADSMQVYRDLRVLSARPSLEEEASVPHLMFGHIDASVNYSVGLWLAAAWGAVTIRLSRSRNTRSSSKQAQTFSSESETPAAATLALDRR